MPATSPQGPAKPFASLNGLRVVGGSLRMPGTGLWTADVRLDATPPAALPTGPRAASVVLGDLTLTGTILPDNSGTFAAAGWYRVAAGAGGWASLVAARAYHNDAGVTLGEVLEDLAADAGETLAPLDAATAALLLPGVDYARAESPAARALGELLALAAPTLPWWVDVAGVTHVSARVVADLPAGTAFDLLDYHPDARLLELAAETLAPFAPGVRIVDGRLPAPLVIRELEIAMGETLRLRAWVDVAPALGEPTAALDNRLVRVLRRAVAEAMPSLPYLGHHRYRVVRMQAGRADLQAVDPARGLPDLSLVRLVPGIPGATLTLAPGGVVLVVFADADPSQPLIVGYPTSDDGAFQPTSVSLGDGDTKIALGGSAHRVARAAPVVAWAQQVVSALAGATPPITVPPIVDVAADNVEVP